MSWPAIVCCIGLVWVIAFDTLGSLAARHFNFRYANLAVVQFLAYCVAGYVAGLHASPLVAGGVGAAMGFVESTLGWAISWYIGPGRRAALTRTLVIRAMALVTIMAMAFALVGAMAADRRFP